METGTLSLRSGWKIIRSLRAIWTIAAQSREGAEELLPFRNQSAEPAVALRALGAYKSEDPFVITRKGFLGTVVQHRLGGHHKG